MRRVPLSASISIGVKTFLNVFFSIFAHVFTVLTFFSNVFFIFKNAGKVQSGKQINKKHFQNNRNETDL